MLTCTGFAEDVDGGSGVAVAELLAPAALAELASAAAG